MNKNCIISFANSTRYYINGLARLNESLRVNFDGDFLGFIGEASLGCEPHEINPYSFKIYAFKKAIEAGYKNILWLDSSCFAIKNVQPCFDEIEENGFLFQDSGHWASTWINDFSLNYLGITREEAREIRLIGNAGLLGLNFSMGKPVEFFKKWEDAMLAGCFKGRWDNKDKTESQSDECLGARHDMISGVILHQMGLSHLMKGGEELLQYAGLYDEVLNDSIIWKAQGM